MMAFLQEAVLRGEPLPKAPPADLTCSADDASSGPYKSVQLDADSSVHWYNRLEDVPQGNAACFVGHEFLDALPIHKFQVPHVTVQNFKKYHEKRSSVMVSIYSRSELFFSFMISQ